MAETVRVRMPDGSVTTLPAGLSKDDMATLLRAEMSVGAGFPQPTSTRAAYGQATTDSLINNLINIPAATGDVLGEGLAHLTAGARTGAALPRLMMSGQDPLQFFNAASEQEAGRGVAAGLKNVPTTTLDETVASLMSGDRDANLSALTENSMALRENHPMASFFGDLTGDALTLGTMRTPVQRPLRNRELRREAFAATAPEGMVVRQGLFVRPKDVPPGIRKEIDDVINSRLVQKLKGGFMRAGETGLEGATLALLNENDPMSTAAYAAGTQMAGSLVMTASGSKTGLGLTAAAAIGMTFHQMLKDVTPGGKDFVLESLETSYEHLTALLAMGALAQLGGLGRASPNFHKNLPEIADALTSVHRGGILSAISEMNDPRNNTELGELIYTKLARDPTFFDPAAVRRLDRAMRSADVGVFEVIDDLMKNTTFRRKVDELYELREAARRSTPEFAADEALRQMPSAPQLGNSPVTETAQMNPLGIVPNAAVEAAINRGASVDPQQAFGNAANVMAQRAASQVLQAVESSNLPAEKKAAIRRAIGNPAEATEETLRQVRALLN